MCEGPVKPGQLGLSPRAGLPDEQGRCVGSDGEESCHEPVRVAHHGSEGWEHAAGYFRVLVQRGKKGVSG